MTELQFYGTLRCVCVYKLTGISASRSEGRNPALILANYMKDLIIVLRWSL